ncbi:16S rRNA (uracil(1498)-N(3))-methyltransferase [Opitutaceae bacterium TAV4]|nr:16S rRNA (uracil(1498)-N(3))-methyltransferase [Opitutaceae bacterium TAV4]RRK01093.1 16S rRNA (uracil(1498)-N(3))-methyltransferase [Opitutaceae bacterium TAV3]
MPDFRVFCSAPASGAHTSAQVLRFLLDAAESHHLVVVNRARAGDPVVVFDGRGREWTGTLAEANKRAAVIAVGTDAQAGRLAPSLPCAVTLAQALPKGGVMDDIVRHATELGVTRIVPLESARTQVHLDGGRSDKKLEKWRAGALEACKQCGNPWLPEIAPVRGLAEFLREVGAAELRLVASLHPGARHMREVVAEARAANPTRTIKSAIWLVGPEGDLTAEEIDAALAAGFQAVTLGALVLRCDTAATYALSVLNHELSG